MCKDLAALADAVAARLSPYRFAHTGGVEEMAARLARLYCPEEEELLRAAALLHDLTKELPEEEQRRLMAENGVALRPDEEASPKIFHGITAPFEIRRAFPQWATEPLLSAVRWHTTGRAGMTLTEALLYLADYIEEGRRFPDCVTLRECFFEPHPAEMGPSERRAHLRTVLLDSLEMTVASLKAEGAPICEDTLSALLWLKEEKNPFERIPNMNEELLEQESALPSLAEASAEELAAAAAAVLDAKKATNVAVLRVTGRSDITDYLVLATGGSGPHVKALADELEYKLGEREVYPLHTDGLNTRSWQIVDYGTVMVHIFDRETREFFNLDKLYKETAEETV